MGVSVYQVPCRSPRASWSCRVPGSKSLTNRALIAAALCPEPVSLLGALDSEDTQLASAALQKLGARIESSGSKVEVDSRSWFRAMHAEPGPDLYLGNAGTAVRFLSAVLAALGVPCRIDGSARMRERPIGELIQGLKALGARVECEAGNACPPLIVRTGGLEGGTTRISGRISSQFFSGLIYAASLGRRDSRIEVTDEFLSRPYIEMTCRMLEAFGVRASLLDDAVEIPGSQHYRSPGVYAIEPDASAATYPAGLAALHGAGVEIEGLTRDSLQGDVAFFSYLEDMGCAVEWRARSIAILPGARLRGLVADLSSIPDAAMTLCVLCCIAEGESRLTGLGNLVHKECDRLSALECELRKLGADIRAEADGFSIRGRPVRELHGARIETYKDHRMAMCLSLPGTRVQGVEILDPACVEKTYPGYWRDLESWLGLR